MGRVVLDQVAVAEPCSMAWDEMSGTGAARFCQHCQKHVHNLSAMTRDEAEQLVCKSAGALCIRYELGADGRVRTLDYQTTNGWRGWSWRLWSVIGLSGALVAGAANAMFFGNRVAPSVVSTPAPTASVGAIFVMGDLMVCPAPDPVPVERPMVIPAATLKVDLDTP